MEKSFQTPPNMFDITIDNYHQISFDLHEKILQNSRDIDPIIHEMFENLLERCINGFNFIEEPLSFEKYMHFYQEVNHHFLKKSKKIIQDDIHGPVFFVGDTHGAIEQSYTIIDFFYKVMLKNPKSKLIFVGDYVDRNPYDLENLTLITAFAILCPNNVVLIRGNHEDRRINSHYGFLDNLFRSFWDRGEELYDEIVTFFTRLPIAHISQIMSDDKKARVLTVHGGIPIDPFNFMEPINLDELENQLNCEVEESSDMDVYSVSMLWSDPDEMIQGILTGEHLNGRMQFGHNVFELFLQENNIDLVVRGHQKWNEGCKVFFNGRLYSLFSTASYDGRPQFSPKILQLEYGKSPKLLDVDPNLLEKEYQLNFTG